MTELIERAIESAKCRIYRVRANNGESFAHQVKADNQAEIMQVTIDALEKQIPKKPLPIITDDNEYICSICPICQQRAVEVTDLYCMVCGQKLDWRAERETDI